MVENNLFVTETDAKAVRRTMLLTTAVLFVVLSALCCLALLISWQTFLFFEIVAVISCGVNLLRRPHHYTLRFEGNRLYVTNNSTGEGFEVFDAPADDFVIKQTKGEEKTDRCSLLVKSTALMFGGVKRCKELKEYISQNFS